jgi:hypothetical protein
MIYQPGYICQKTTLCSNCQGIGSLDTKDYSTSKETSKSCSIFYPIVSLMWSVKGWNNSLEPFSSSSMIFLYNTRLVFFNKTMFVGLNRFSSSVNLPTADKLVYKKC